jgi:hypothetical protein
MHRSHLGQARRAAATAALLWMPVCLNACAGLMAGPESSKVTPVPASRDSAYARARRALTAESFSMDVVDSTGGHLTGTRYATRDAQLGSAAACRMTLALDVRGDGQQAQVASTSRWVAPDRMSDKAPTVCERNRTEVLDRIAQVLNPPVQ